MAGTEVVTFALASGSKVTAPRHLAERLGWKQPEPDTDETNEKPKTVKRSPRKRS